MFPGGAADDGDGGLRTTALRELVEEAGIELAGPDALARLVALDHAPPPPDPLRHALLRRRRAPAGADARPDGEELVDMDWFAPAAALDAHARGELELMFPTIVHLEELAGFGSATAVLAAAPRPRDRAGRARAARRAPRPALISRAGRARRRRPTPRRSRGARRARRGRRTGRSAARPGTRSAGRGRRACAGGRRAARRSGRRAGTAARASRGSPSPRPARAWKERNSRSALVTQTTSAAMPASSGQRVRRRDRLGHERAHHRDRRPAGSRCRARSA